MHGNSSLVSTPAVDSQVDLFGPWSVRRKLAVAIAAAASFFWCGPRLVFNATEQTGVLIDFIQDWCSAKDHLEGRPIYSSLRVSAARHGVRRIDDDQPTTVEVNAHPPTSVLLALPFGCLSFSSAFIVFKTLGVACLVGSILIYLRTLGWSCSVWSALALGAILCASPPLWMNLYQGQWSPMLLFLLTAVWAADRTGRPLSAGGFLGLACAVKLFPAILLLYFGVRRQWRALFGWGLSFGAAALVAWTMFKAEDLRTYREKVVPDVLQFTGHPLNASIAGFWGRLFDPTRRDPTLVVDPVRRDKSLAQSLTRASLAMVLIVLGWKIWSARSSPGGGPAFGAAASAMLLAGPLTWDHSLLIALLPLGLALAHSERSGTRLLLGVVLAGLWTPTSLVDMFWCHWTGTPIYRTAMGLTWQASVGQSLAILSIPSYALAVLFVTAILQRGDPTVHAPATTPVGSGG